MIGQIVYPVTLLLIVLGMFWALKRGTLVANSLSQSIPVEYESLEESKIPLITLTSLNGMKYTFLVDTGASANYLNACLLQDFNEEERHIQGQDSFYGAEGQDNSATIHTLTFTHRNSKLTDEYLATDISVALGRLSADLGKDIHGILGVPFLRKHSFSLDVNRMMVWKKL